MAALDIHTLPAPLRKGVHRIVLGRVNQARKAMGRPTLDELQPCEPNNSCECLLGEHLRVYASTVTVHFDTEGTAMNVAEAWGTTADGCRVHLPRDLQIATAAFDAGQVPELIRDPDFEREDYGDPLEESFGEEGAAVLRYHAEHHTDEDFVPTES